MKKKFIVLSGIFALVFIMSGCGEGSATVSSANPDSNVPPVAAASGGVPVTQYVSGVKGLSTLPSIPANPEQ
jgi:PBP1b-binding outer membrane lipoprotein LpoB